MRAVCEGEVCKRACEWGLNGVKVMKKYWFYTYPVTVSQISLKKHACLTKTVIFDSEARPNFDTVLDERDEIIGLLVSDPTNEQTIAANETYELLLTFVLT